MTAAPLLVELHTEELPPKALRRLGAAFAEGIAEGLRSRGLAATAGHRAFATPRRLAVLVEGVLERAPDRDVELKGPSVKVGLDADGRPTQALLKWAERQNVALESLERRGEGKQESFHARVRLPGRAESTRPAPWYGAARRTSSSPGPRPASGRRGMARPPVQVSNRTWFRPRAGPAAGGA